MRLALAQINQTVGDLAGNERRIVERLGEARDAGARLVLFPECAVSGYPAEDLLLKDHFLADCRAALDRIAEHTVGVVAVVGFPERAHDVFNAAAVLADGELRAVYRKTHLPNYGVFDEVRYFQAGEEPALIEVDGVLVGLTICEDIWQPGPPASVEALAGAQLIVNLSASPYEHGKPPRREQMVVQRARDYLAAMAFCALVGGQDELVFDGHSFVCDHDGRVLARSPGFAEDLLVCDVDPSAARRGRLRDTRHRVAARELEAGVPTLARLRRAPALAGAQAVEPRVAPFLDRDAEVYAALVLGLRDYVEKNGFDHVVLGLSGGIDSTLVALLAVDALGADRVSAVSMPSRYSSQGTRSDARALAENLGIDFRELPIGAPMDVYDEVLAEAFAGRDPDITEENLQARIRGTILMALSNKFGWLVLTTGNKSELSVGYSTLYGDTAGGFAVIKDVPKTLVYRLVDLRARRDPVSPVPETIVTRAPSAELRPDQTDQDSLPDYETLDRILELYVEQDLGREQIMARGLPQDAVDRVIRLVDLAEYKRRQNPPGIRITPKAFGRDRRMPITNRYRG
ncbi:MAG TPA: NAD+ synthase [Solirubrobacteraceae bacterium]|jgi:NAD+ synthase (glutamine-hydrolysing)|nr:NAD+ synthase [Solirubrobacteraceae bacterium]